MTTATTPIRLSSPEDLLAAAPYLIGYHPGDSIVFLGLGFDSSDVTITGRYDLSEPNASRDPTRLVRALQRQKVASVLLIGYGPPARVTPDIDAIRTALAVVKIPIREALRATDGRYWSYLCNGDCCPIDGTPYDLTTERVSAAMTYEGFQALPDRAALTATLRTTDELARARIRAKAAKATDRLKALLLAASPDTSTAWDRWRDEGADLLHRLVADARTDNALPNDEDLATLAVMLTHTRVRDEAWALVDEHPLHALLPLWTYVVRHVSDEHLTAPAVLLAYAAWRTGNGALARVAVERALAVEPEYRLALMLQDVLNTGIPPAELPPVTREWIATSYEEGEEPGEAATESIRELPV